MTSPDKKTAFLQEVLGPDGAEALLKAVRRSPSLAAVLVPRAILSWTMAAASWGYDGPIPGLMGSSVTFRKAETPGLFNGTIDASSLHVALADTTLYRIAAHVAMALQAEPEPLDKKLRDLDIARLGKSIDALAKAQLLMQHRTGMAAAPQVMSTHGDIEVMHNGVGTKPYLLRRKSDQRMLIDQVPTLEDAQKLAQDAALGKVELPGQTAKPREALAPIGPAEPAKQPVQKPAEIPRPDAKGPGVKAPPRTKDKVPPVKIPSLKVGKSEAHSHRCKLCQQPQFGGPGRFVGCLCFSALAQDVLVKTEGPYYELTFGSSWDQDARSALLETLHLT